MIVVVRDLWSGDPVPELEVRPQILPTARQAGRPGDVRTAADGTIHIGGDTEVSLQVTTPGWWAPAQNTAEVLETGEFWVYRRVEVRVQVVPQRGNLTTAAVELHWVPVGRLESAVEGPPPTEWLRGANRWGPRPIALGGVDADGAAVLTIDRIGTPVIGAWAPGWQATWKDVDFDRSGVPLPVSLVLRPASRVTGRLVSSAGDPLAGARVVVSVTIWGPYDEGLIHRHNLLAPHGGITGKWRMSENTSCVTVFDTAFTGPDGSFAVATRADGEARIVAYPDAHAIAETGPVQLTDDLRGVELVAAPDVVVSRIRILFDGSPLREADLTFSDQSVYATQSAFAVRTDSDGFAATSWLVQGRRYVVIPQSAGVPADHRRAHWFTAAGQTELDLKSLPTRP